MQWTPNGKLDPDMSLLFGVYVITEHYNSLAVSQKPGCGAVISLTERGRMLQYYR